MPIQLVIFAVGFLIISLIYSHYELYKDEKYKTMINLFMACNILLSASIFMNQNNLHDGQIISNLTTAYSTHLNELYGTILKETIGDKYVYDELFAIPYKNNTVRTNIPYTFSNVCYRINCALSNYALYYYTHIELDEYTILVKRQNFRMTKIIDRYLESPAYRTVLDGYLNEACGLYTLKYFKEFFDISASKPNTKEEQLIATNRVIDGKLNGEIVVIAPTAKK